MTNDQPPPTRVFSCLPCAQKSLTTSVYFRAWDPTRSRDLACLHFYAQWTRDRGVKP